MGIPLSRFEFPIIKLVCAHHDGIDEYDIVGICELTLSLRS